ncbi:hypothetical protein [Sporomusa sp.]|uniref:hypothetical protein n=1 Tax=Sporomusa sp. TaxID=2078658 RepID=UPI002B5F7FC8|nr:hypothetical protein [Sporomusa sp.]HWR07766.1 hypothetical protein [Sporomusa sp.]
MDDVTMREIALLTLSKTQYAERDSVSLAKKMATDYRRVMAALTDYEQTRQRNEPEHDPEIMNNIFKLNRD